MSHTEEVRTASAALPNVREAKRALAKALEDLNKLYPTSEEYRSLRAEASCANGFLDNFLKNSERFLDSMATKVIVKTKGPNDETEQPLGARSERSAWLEEAVVKAKSAAQEAHQRGELPAGQIVETTHEATIQVQITEEDAA